jgi:hypothetical protein
MTIMRIKRKYSEFEIWRRYDKFLAEQRAKDNELRAGACWEAEMEKLKQYCPSASA